MRSSDLSEWGRDYRGWSPTTRTKYVYRVRKADEWFRANHGKSLSRATAKELERYFFGPTVKPTVPNRNGLRSALVAYYEMLGRTKNNPAKTLPYVRRRPSIPRALVPEDARVVLTRSDACEMPGKVAISLWLLAGLRFTEGLKLQWEQIHYPYVTFIGKGSKERTVGVHPDLQLILESYRAVCPCPQWLFPSPRRPYTHASETWLRQRIKAALDSTPPHALRHTWATRILECDAYKIHELSEALGHNSLDTTKIYLKVRPERLAEGINKLSY